MSSDCQHKNYVYAASCSMIFDVSLRFCFAFASASLQLSLNCFLLLSLVRFGFTSPHSISIFIFISISISFGCRNSSCCHFVGSTFYDVFNYISERDMEEKEKTRKREGGGEATICSCKIKHSSKLIGVAVFERKESKQMNRQTNKERKKCKIDHIKSFNKSNNRAFYLPYYLPYVYQVYTINLRGR